MKQYFRYYGLTNCIKSMKGKLMAKKKHSKKKENSESCCCCESSASASSNGSAVSYSSSDDSYKGRKRKVVVDFLYLDLSCCDRCQGADQRVEMAVERCRDVLLACGYEISLNSVHVDNQMLAEAYRFESSPTVRVNGVDICPSIEENDCACCSDMSDTPVTCRIFPFNGTYYEVPPTDMLVRGIMEVVLQNRQPDDPPLPYKLPENLRQFYQGVEKKAQKDAVVEPCCCGSGDHGNKGKGDGKKKHRNRKHGKGSKGKKNNKCKCHDKNKKHDKKFRRKSNSKKRKQKSDKHSSKGVIEVKSKGMTCC